ncbi:MAG: hypothetical protein JWQ71_1453 [Pedosphaera sp.]|nr:hypothetical protein [Pedosphaera sp.]
MTLRNKIICGILGGSLAALTASANDRRFTYTYEPETMPKGSWEFEQWVTSRIGRNATVGQEGFQKWELRHSLEYGVTDNYTVELYLNESLESFRDPAAGMSSTRFMWDGVSLENRYMVLNPTEHPVGLTLYLEPRISETETEVEEKIILGQRHGDWKWALNLTHATEWTDHYHATEGELELSFGVARDLNKHWAVGLELRDHSELPEYREWENTALYLGPTVSYRRANWWATLSVMPQIYGANFIGNPDGNSHLELEGHERLNIRLIFGIEF